MSFHHSVVHSIKGGCGKTTFSLLLALQKNQKSVENLIAWSSRVPEWENRIRELEALGTRDEPSEQELKALKAAQKDLKDTHSKFESAKKSYGELIRLSRLDSPEKQSQFTQLLEEIRPLCAKTLVIDCDYKGTGMESSVFGLVKTPKVGASGRRLEYYSNRLLQSFHGSKVEDYIALKDVYFNEGFLDAALDPKDFPYPPYWIPGAAWLDLMLCARALSVKNRFIRSEKIVHGIPVQPSIYSAAMSGILNELAVLSSVTGNPMSYDNIVYDLSPGMDEYTEALLELLVERKNDKKINDTIDLYYVTTLDNAHIEATIQHLKRLRDKNDYNLAYFNGDKGEIHVHVVVNELPTRYVKPDGRKMEDITLDKLMDKLSRERLACGIFSLEYIKDWAENQTYHSVQLQKLIERNRKASTDKENQEVADEIRQYQGPFPTLHESLVNSKNDINRSGAVLDSKMFTALLKAEYKPWTQSRVPRID